MTSWTGSAVRQRMAVFAVAIGCILLIPAATAGAKRRTGSASGRRRSSRPAAPRAMYWGAWIGKEMTGTNAPYDMSAVTKFQQMVNKPLSLVEWSLARSRTARFAVPDLQVPLRADEDSASTARSRSSAGAPPRSATTRT